MNTILFQRRSGDPRERIRKEQDGIVLSPQRRSFNSGCFVTQAQPPLVRRPESPIGKADRDRWGTFEIGFKKIPSGQVLSSLYKYLSGYFNYFKCELVDLVGCIATGG